MSEGVCVCVWVVCHNIFIFAITPNFKDATADSTLYFNTLLCCSAIPCCSRCIVFTSFTLARQQNTKTGIMSAELRATFGVHVGVVALFSETAAQQCKDDIKAANAGFSSQFTRCTRTKVQILTYEDRPAYV